MASFLQMSSNSLPDNVATWTVGSNDPTTGLILSYKEKKNPIPMLLPVWFSGVLDLKTKILGMGSFMLLKNYSQDLKGGNRRVDVTCYIHAWKCHNEAH